MSTLRRVAPWLAAAAIMTVGVAGFVAYFVDATPGLLVEQGPLSLQPEAAGELALFFDTALVRTGQITVHLIGVAIFWGTGLLILARGRQAPMRVLTALTLLLLGTALFSPTSALTGGWGVAGRVIGSLRPGPELWRSAAGLALLAFCVVFPDGKPLSRVWSIGYAVFAAHVVLFGIASGSWLDPRSWAPAAGLSWTVAPGLLAVTVLLIRFRTIEPERRPQIRLVVIAVGSTVATILAFWALQPRLEQGLFDLVLATRRLAALHDLNLLLLLTASLLLLPVAVGISVVRYRLWDLGLFVNRALVYAALTAAVAAVFLVGMVGVGSALASTVGGGRGIAGVITGVAVVLVFQPLRRKVQTSVDRRFYRQLYDADRAVDRFSREVTDLVRPVSIAAALGAILRQTVQPESTWVELNQPPPATTIDVIDRDGAPDWPEGAAVMVPLVAQGHPVGAVFLGRRRSGRPYAAADRRLLVRIAAAASPAVRVGQLVEEQERLAVERARLDGELAVARTIQRDLLPHHLPEIAGWRFAARYESSREVGGDYYDVIVRQDGTLGLVVADVSGKGVPAAILMAACRAVVRSVADAVDDPAEVLHRVNVRLTADMTPGMFVTCFYGVLHPESGRLSFANAGHPLAVVGMPDGTSAELRATGMPFGWMAEAAYESVVQHLPPGAVVVIPSDGVIEARSPGGEMWGTGRFLAVVAGADGPGVVEGILAALRDFCAPATDLGDDVTMLALARRLGG